MVVLGRIVAPYGIKGWIKIQPFTEAVGTLLDHTEWWLSEAGDWRAVEPESGRVHGATILAKFPGIETPEQAVRLKGTEVGIPRSALPPVAEDEFYWTDLEGMQVANTDGVALGEVDSLMDNGVHGILVVRGDRERLIPFVPAYVIEVDREGRRILVDWGADY